MVLHLLRSPHVGVYHSADVALIAGAEEPFHGDVAGVDCDFAAFAQDLGPFVEGTSLLGVDPGFGDVEIVEFGADDSVDNRCLQRVQAYGCDPGLHRLIGEHVRVWEWKFRRQCEHVGRGQGYAPQAEWGAFRSRWLR